MKGCKYLSLPQWRGRNIWVCPNEGVPIIWVCPNEGVPIIWVCSSEGLYFRIYMFTFLSIKWIQLEHKYSFNWFFQWKLQLIKCPYCTPQWRVFILNRPNEGVYIWKFAPMKGCKFGNSPQWRGINLEIRPSEGSPYIFLRRAPPYIYIEVPSPGCYPEYIFSDITLGMIYLFLYIFRSGCNTTFDWWRHRHGETCHVPRDRTSGTRGHVVLGRVVYKPASASLRTFGRGQH